MRGCSNLLMHVAKEVHVAKLQLPKGSAYYERIALISLCMLQRKLDSEAADLSSHRKCLKMISSLSLCLTMVSFIFLDLKLVMLEITPHTRLNTRDISQIKVTVHYYRNWLVYTIHRPSLSLLSALGHFLN